MGSTAAIADSTGRSPGHAASAAVQSDPVARLQTVHIRVDRGYVPSGSRAHANEPLRIAFLRVDRDSCTERVVFSSPRMEARLASGGVTTVDLPPQPAGTLRFTCGMGRYRGEIKLVERRPGRRAALAGAGALIGAFGLIALATFAVLAGAVNGSLAAVVALLGIALAIAAIGLARRRPVFD